MPLNSYFQVPALTASEFRIVNTSENAIEKLRQFVPLANTYTTVFSFAGVLYYIDSDGRKVEKCYQNLGTFIPELPTVEVEKIVKEPVKVPTGISEDLLIRAIAAASHQSIESKYHG